MVLNESEVQTGLSFALQTIFKNYDVAMQEMHVKMDDEKIILTAVLLYNQYHVDVVCDFQIKYENQCFIFENIHGKIEYLFLQFPIMSFLKSFLKDSHLCFTDNQVQYQIDFPIQEIGIQEGQLFIVLKNNQSVSP